MTPTASVEADHDKAKDVWVMDEAANPFGTVGAIVSGAAEVVTDIALDTPLLFPAASYADTVNE